MDCAARSSRCVEEIRRYVTLGEYSTATQHVPLPRRVVPPFRWYITYLSSSACIAEVPLPRIHNADLDSAPFRKDNTPYATQLSRACGRTYTKCRYSRRAPMADPATSPQSHIPTCAHNTYHRRQHHSAIWRHRAVCPTWCTMGSTSPSRDVRARCIFWWAVWRVPELRASFICRDHSSWRGGTVVRVVLHHRSGMCVFPSAK